MSPDNTYHDANRYDSAADRKEDRKQKRLHEQAKSKNPELHCSTGAFESRQTNDWLRDIKPAYRREYLFGDLWRPGEVTVLAGETGVGKSILAVQIAESISRGTMPFREPQHQIQFGPATPPVSKLFPPPRRQRVLYLDLETSPAQMLERYTCPSPILGKLPVRYRFASYFERSGYGEYIKIPEHFRGDLARFLRHSVDLAIAGSEATVIIIDDLAALEPSAPRSNGPARWMRRFRAMAAQGHSFLILTHLKTRPSRRAPNSSTPQLLTPPLSLSDLTLGRQIAELADTVIAIGKTTLGPEYRYLKVLKSKNAPLVRTGSGSDRLPAAIGDVLGFQIQRTPGFSEVHPRRPRVRGCGPTVTLDGSAARTPHVSKGSSPATENTESTELSKFVIPVSPTPLIPNSPTPFLGFTYLGPAAEHDLIRDHTAEALKAQREHERELKKLSKRTSKDILVDAVMDGSYLKYLKGK